jgi:SAM-dependent methyltransferase
MDLPDYYNRVNRELLRLMPPDSRVIVEIGCGAGALARAYRRINPNVRYLGVELNPEAARFAGGPGGIDHIFVGDAAAIEPSALGLDAREPSVDCLVFGDVLEHMIDPWSVLARMAGWVREGRQILACIPNVQHYSLILNLMRGHWEYQDEGLLDRTHLRFFTLEEIGNLFNHAGLQMFGVESRWWPDETFDRFQQIIAPVLGPLGIDAARFASQTRPVQYVVRALRGRPPTERMIVWSLLGSVIGSEVRIQEPHQFMATIPGVRIVTGTGVQFAELGQTYPDERKVFVQQRIIIPIADHIQLQRALLQAGYLIVAEFDDDPLHFDDLVRSDFFALRACHCVQTSTETLAETLRAYHPHVRVFPNQVASLPPPRIAARGNVEAGAIPATLFFGALNRERDWAPVMPELSRALKEHRGRLRVQVVYDRAFFEALETSDKAFESLCTYDRYHSLLDEADISLLPLEPTRFNQHKSELKFLECAAHGVAALASPTVYSRVIRPGETGLIYHSPEEFASCLADLICDPGLRHRLAENAYHDVAETRLLSQHYREREAWYRLMFDRLPDLNRELRQRLPGL